MNRGELIELGKFMMNVNDAQLNSQISLDSWNRSVQLSYNRLWNRIRNEIAKPNSTAYYDFSWPNATPIITIPNQLQGRTLLGFYLRNNDLTTGRRINVQCPSKFTLMWPDSGGPVAAPTQMRGYCYADAEILLSDDSSPQLLLPAHHEVIAYETVIYLKTLQDKTVPSEWVSTRDDLEFYAQKELMTRPLYNVAAILPDDVDRIVFMK